MRDPLLDKDFLKLLDSQKSHEVYARIIALTIDEYPIEEITGKVTGGSINIDGTSAIRRSCSVQLVADEVNINDVYWGLECKFKLEIGLRNTINPEYDDIIWFRQGIFLITSFNTSYNLTNYNISITGKDKMCLLNGDIGGKITSLTVDFGTYDQQDSDGNIVRYDYPIKEIILEAVHQYAGEPYSNIIVSDLDDQGLELMEYRGDVDLFMLIDENSTDVTNIRFDDETAANTSYYLASNNQEIKLTDPNFVYDTRLNVSDFSKAAKTATRVKASPESKEIYTVARVTYGQTCGYRVTELTYAGDLISQIDNAITSSLLDKLVQMLGTYEYFYDVDGVFHFQRKKVHINTSWNNIIKSDGDIYADSAAYTSSTSYSFTDSNLISSFQNTPNLANVRNDFAIWGKRTSASGAEIPFHLRYAIDNKPCYYKAYDGTIYLTQEEKDRIEENIDGEYVNEFSTQTASVGNGKSIFKVTPLPEGMPDDWWEVDDWGRRYLYLADVDNEHPMSYYLKLSSEELVNIISSAQQAPVNSSIHDFYYYCNQLHRVAFGHYNETWGTMDWLKVFDDNPPAQKAHSYDYSSSYYPAIRRAAQNGQTLWGFLIDTSINPKTGKEYITSMEHGYATTNSEAEYPTYAPGCGHRFAFAFDRKTRGGTYHVYVHSPGLPDTLKTDTQFLERINTDSAEKKEITITNFKISEWREIIYQMAKDYYKYQHNNDFMSVIAQNNPDHYPLGQTGYEQYYIDMEGFWRYLYNPDIKPIDFTKDTHQKANHYYIWDKDKEEFTDYAASDATSVLPLNNEETYYYFKGSRTLDGILNQVKKYQDTRDKAELNKQQELRALTEDNADKASEIVEKYDKIINAQDKLLNTESPKNKDRHLKDLLTATPDKYEEYINELWPNYEQTSPTQWNDYEPYLNYIDDGKYYLYQFAKDLSTFSIQEKYYKKENDNYVHTYAALGFIDGTMVSKGFYVGQKYYRYIGFDKVSTLRPGQSYYTYNTFVPEIAGKYDEKTTYYEKSMDIVAKNNIFTVVPKVDPNKVQNYFKIAERPNAAQPGKCNGYRLILTIPQQKYYITTVVNKVKYTTEATSFARGNTYTNEDGSFSFTFAPGTVYYTDRGFVEAFDLSDLSTEDTYIYTDSVGEQVVSTGNVLYLGHAYYGYIKQKNDTIQNGNYFIKENNQFVEHRVLREFKRGGKYYTRRKGYDKADLFQSYDPEQTYYIYENDEYTKIKTKVDLERELNENKEDKLTIAQINRLGAYGIKVDEDGNIYGLGQNYTFYTESTRYREVNYYAFTFYKPAEKYAADQIYYVKVGMEYKPADPAPTNRMFYADKKKYYELIKNEDLEGKVYLTDEFNPNTYWTVNLLNPEKLIFWFDFLDLDDGGELAQYSVRAIGDRPKSINDDNLKSIYYRDTPTVIFCGSDGTYIKTFVSSETFAAIKNTLYEKDSRGNFTSLKESDISYTPNKDYYRELEFDDKQTGYVYVNLNDTVDNLFSISGQWKSAFDVLDEYLYEYAYCTASITMNCIPIYYLQPNTRVFVYDERSGIEGEYIVSRISIPLQYNGMMSISATKAIDRII